MINVEKGIVEEIIERVGNSQRLKVVIGEKRYKAINYNYLTGSAEKGDNVLLNTTAEDLKLGTGGYHFVLFNLTKGKTKDIDGHIMKLRYSPYQISCLSIEETKSPFHDVLKDKEEISGMPVIISSLHSQLPSIFITLKKIKEDIKISYIQTDAGALPIDFSYIYSYLRDKGLIDVSITSEHSFGGEWEAINIYSGLLASKHVFKADITVIGLGPGIVGTGTKYGTTAVKQGEALNAVNILEGIPIYVPRIQFKDTRKRHYGLSHHSVTVLNKIALSSCEIAFPVMEKGKKKLVEDKIEEFKLNKKHRIKFYNVDFILDELKNLPFTLKTMGREVEEEPEFFNTGAAGALMALEKLKSNENK